MNIPSSSLIQVPNDFLANVWGITSNTFGSIVPLVVLAVAFSFALVLGKYSKNLIVGRRRGYR
jgi:hypothetical protein